MNESDAQLCIIAPNVNAGKEEKKQVTSLIVCVCHCILVKLVYYLLLLFFLKNFAFSSVVNIIIY